MEELTYPFHEHTITVTHCGRICFKGRKINLSHVFAGQNVGVTQVNDRVWLVTFMHYDLGYFDDEAIRLEPTLTRTSARCWLPQLAEALGHSISRSWEPNPDA